MHTLLDLRGFIPVFVDITGVLYMTYMFWIKSRLSLAQII